MSVEVANSTPDYSQQASIRGAGEASELSLDKPVGKRKQIEEKLAKSEAQYRRLFEAAQDGILILDGCTGRIIDVNPFLINMLGYRREDFLGKCLWEIGPFKDVEASKAAFRELQEKAYIRYEDLPLEAKDGRQIQVEFVSNSYFAGQRKVIQCNIRDITDRKQAEALRKSEEKFRSLVESTSDWIWEIDRNGIYTYASPKVKELLGYEPEEVVGKTPFDFMPAEEANRIANKFKDIIKTSMPIERLENTCRHKNGHPVILETSGVPVFDSKGQLRGYRGVDRDITERKQAEEALRQSEKRYRTILEDIVDDYFEADLAGNITFVNDATCRSLGYSREELVGMNYRSFTAEDDVERLYQVYNEVFLTGKPNKGFSWKFVRKNGSEGFTDASVSALRDREGKIVGFRGISRDMTERKKEEQQMLMSGKLASVGEITASVAHEINNPLTGVLGYAQLLTSRHDIPQDIKRDLDIIYQEGQRVVKIVQSLLHFARQHKPDKSLTDINELIERTLELQIYKLRTSNITLTTKLADDLPWVVVDYNQIQQVILNIVVNATQAMAEARHKGKITVTTGMNKDYVRISIADNGPGIAKENINKVFDPFFTTKPVGSGSGLGLSVCHSIITEHGGNICVERTNGKGATFYIDLPVVTGDEAVIKEKAIAEKKRPRRRRKVRESILVVEDEPAIRGILTEVLSEDGFQVHTASSGKVALRKLEEGLDNIYIVDLKMPDMSGEQLYKIMKNKHPNASERVIFMTGDTVTAETQNLLASTGRPFLNKPFDYTELIKMIDDALRERRATVTRTKRKTQSVAATL